MGRRKKYATEEERKSAAVQKTLRYRNRNREAVNAYRRKYAQENPERISGYQKKWYYGNHAETLEYHKSYREELKKQIIVAYGGACKCCGESEPLFLTIDHVHGYKNRPDLYSHNRSGGARFYLWLRRNNFPQEGFALLCFNCNLGRAKAPDGICPHVRKKYHQISTQSA